MDFSNLLSIAHLFQSTTVDIESTAEVTTSPLHPTFSINDQLFTKSIIIGCPSHYSRLANVAIIGANYKLNKWWRSLWDSSIERPMLCRIAGDSDVLLTLITSFLPLSACLYFSPYTYQESAKLASGVM